MFSPAKAIAVAALVFAVGGLLAAQPRGPDSAAAPASSPSPQNGLPGVSPAAGQSEAPLESQAPLDPLAANYWTGTYTGTGAELGVTGSHDGYFEEMGGIVRGEVVADDPRIAGLLTQVFNTHSTAEPYVAIFSGTARIDNDAGAWVGTFAAWGASSGGDEVYVLEGEGAYDGLTAAFRLQEQDIFKALRVDSPLRGVILPAELPPPPDPVAPPAE